MFRIAQILVVAYLVLALVMVGLTMLPAPEPVQVTVVYGTEKRDWLQAAAEQFLAGEPTTSSGAPIEIVLEGQGSREMVLDVADGDLQPTVLSPASSIHIEILRDDWARRNNGQAIVHTGTDAPQALVVTPLVVVAWEERADVLNIQGPNQLWGKLHQLVEEDGGWDTFGKPEWGLGRWGHTNPESSNSGMQTIVLLAYAYHDKAADLTVEDVTTPGFKEWFDDFESAVPEFPSSTGYIMDRMLQFGPSEYSFIVVYENLAIESFDAAQGRGGAIRVYYPPDNILSDHPYAILDAPWVSPEQREAAALFRDFLLTEETQQLALAFGFRPANTAVAFDTPDSPFTRYADQGIQTEIARSVEVPSALVINELIDLWRRGDYD